MPPEPTEYVGAPAIRQFLSTVPARGELERFTLVAARANGQPAFACYLRTHESRLSAYGFPDTSVFRQLRPAPHPFRVIPRRWSS
jgi:hypothetical protein